LFLLMRFCNK